MRTPKYGTEALNYKLQVALQCLVMDFGRWVCGSELWREKGFWWAEDIAPEVGTGFKWQTTWPEAFCVVTGKVMRM